MSSITPGTRLGTYEITETLGAGGMGEVYRARDSKLQRDVAIKILPEIFVADPERVMRFEREAQALAALNHPNIAQVYGLLELPADHTGRGIALVMELVEGEDLAQRLRRGAIPVDECLLIARQIAEGLEAAHDRGIVHRDLKPANIRVRPDGAVKVLDFGLAKATETTAAARVGSQDSPTFTSPARATELGVVLGTAAYMAPEQAKGKPVDKRADIWAFGVVLFEMLSGRTLFAGETVSETLAAVLRDDLQLDDLPPATPPVVRRLLARCMEREPKLRLRDIGEARIALTPGAHDGEATVGARRTSPATRYGILAAGAALALALGLAAGWLAFGQRSAPVVPVHFTFEAEQAGEGAIISAPSPDGRHVAVAGGTGLWIRSIDSTEMRQLVRDMQPHQVFWSPDSRWIAVATDTELTKVPREGGEVVRIADISRLPGPFNLMGGGVWLPDDRIVFTTAFTGLLEVPAGGGEPRTLVAPATTTEDFHGITALPSGGFVTAAHDGAAVDKLIALRNGTRTIVLDTKGEDLAAPAYSPTGHLLFRRLTSDGIWALPFDETTLTRKGEPFLVLPGAAPRISADGRMLVTTAVGGTGETRMALVTEGAKSEQRVGPDRVMVMLGPPTLSADGRRVALVSSQSGTPSAWIHPVGPGLATQLTEGEPIASVAWLPGPGGLLVVRGANWCLSGDCFSIERHPFDGGAKTTIAAGWSPDPSPDGAVMVYTKRESAEWDLAVQPLDGSGEPTLFQGGPGWQFGARFSPDGRYVAYMSMDSGRGDVYVARYPSGEKRRVTSDGGYWPRWSRDGTRLYYARGTGVMALEVSTRDTFSIGASVEVLPQGTLSQMPNTRWPTAFDVSSEGKQFLVHRPQSAGELPKPLVHVLLDWARLEGR